MNLLNKILHINQKSKLKKRFQIILKKYFLSTLLFQDFIT